MPLAHVLTSTLVRSNLIIDRECKQLEGDGGECKVLVIQSSSASREILDIQDLSVPEDSIKNWNLAVFRGPYRSAEANNPAIVKHLYCEKLRLNFDTAEERKFFTDAFLVAMCEYTEALAKYEEYKRQLQGAGGHPRGPSRRYASTSHVPTKAALSPMVESGLTNGTPSVDQEIDKDEDEKKNPSLENDTATVYSAADHLDGYHLNLYESELADGLANWVRMLQPDVSAKEAMADTLPDLLRNFALRLGQHSTTQSENSVMYFVHRYRQ
jgi:hypothetical protein